MKDEQFMGGNFNPYASAKKETAPKKSPKKLSMFDALKQMYEHDVEQDTRLLGVCPDLISANMQGKNGKVIMGVPGAEIMNIAAGTRIPVLLLIDKEEYFKLTGQI